MSKYIRYLILLLMLSALSCREEISEFEIENDLGTILEYIYEEEDRYGNFIRLIESTQLVHTLDAYNPFNTGYTLFIPSDEAFDSFFSTNEGFNNIDELIADKEYSYALGRYHILNMKIKTNDFPFGAFPDTTLSGDLLTVGFSDQIDSTIYLINNEARVILNNVEASNGFIHEIDKVLEPVVFTAYELLKTNPEYSIISSVFDITNLKDKMGLSISDEKGEEKENQYTLLVEPDSVFNRNGIYSVDDLIGKLTPEMDNYTSEENALYQFGAYHILEGRHFLDNFQGTTNYNTFASLPIQINAGLKIRINIDAERVFDTIVNNADTTYIDYIEPYYNSSNVLSQNGPIHFIDQVMYLYKPGLSDQLFQFHDEPVINRIRNIPNEYIFSDQSEFSVISWEGTDEIIYVKSGTSIQPLANDYLQIQGDFTLEYKIPKILPGEYQVIMRANAFGEDNAVVELFIDGNKTGSLLNLTSSGNSAGNPYVNFNQNTIEFTDYRSHTITIKSLIPGIMIWDFIKFEPV